MKTEAHTLSPASVADVYFIDTNVHLSWMKVKCMTEAGARKM